MPSALVGSSFGEAGAGASKAFDETGVPRDDPEEAAVPRRHACLLGTENPSEVI